MGIAIVIAIEYSAEAVAEDPEDRGRDRFRWQRGHAQMVRFGFEAWSLWVVRGWGVAVESDGVKGKPA